MMLTQLAAATYLPSGILDHCPLQLIFSIYSCARPPWHLQSSWLRDPDIEGQINDHIMLYWDLNRDTVGPQIVCDAI